MSPSVVGERHRTGECRADDGANVDLLDGWIEMRERQMLRRRSGRQCAALFRSQVLGDCHRSGKRALADEQIAIPRPARQLVRRAGVAGVYDPRRASLEGICHTLRRVRNPEAGQPKAAGQIDRHAGRNLAYGKGEARRRDPLAVRRREARQERRRSGRSDNLDRQRARRKKTVLPGEDERRQVAVMINVKVRQRDVRDRLPRIASLGKPPCDAAAAVDEQADGRRLEQVAGAASRRGERDRAGAEGCESHFTVP